MGLKRLAIVIACWGTMLLAGPAPKTPVILISIDTLRADHLSAYGSRVRTPNIDAFAQHGSVFAHAATQIPLTLPSHTTLLTSTYPFASQVEENAEKVPAKLLTLASVLRGQGYRTGAFIGSVFLERQLGLDRGFDVYDSPFNFAAFSPLSGELLFGGQGAGAYRAHESRGGPLVLRAATEWLSAEPAKPAFAFIHLFDLHQPYRVTEDDARRQGLSRYDAQLVAIDAMLGRFREFLVRSGLWDRALIVLVSDHGESLGEHGERTHGYFIYQSTLWTPLIVHWPAAQTRAPRTDQPVGLIDVAPTILDFLGIAPPAAFQGHSLLASTAGPPVYSESLYAHDAFGWAPLRSIRTGDWQYIDAPEPELYNLRIDMSSRDNVYRENSELASRMRAQLERIRERYAGALPAQDARGSAGDQRLLNSLGYLARGPAYSASSAAPDPKARLAEYQLYERALDAGYDGHTAAAAGLLRRIVREDPKNILAGRDLAQCEFEQGDTRTALSLFEKVLAASPGDYLSRYGAGLAEEKLGRLEAARNDLKRACQVAPEAVQCQRALAAIDDRIRATHPQ